MVKVTRREFMCVSLSSSVVAFVPVRVHAGFTHDQQRTLLAVARTIFPHDHVSDLIYMRAVANVDNRCLGDTGLSTILNAGLSVLESSCRQPFLRASPRARIDALKSMQGGQFFQVLYSELLDALYGPHEMWSLFVQSALSSERV